jgi:periplasmic protein CpxP/Spy
MTASLRLAGPATSAIAAVFLGAVFALASPASIAQQPTNAPHASSHTEIGSDDIVAHVSGMLDYLYAQVGATDTQKTKLASIIAQARSDLSMLQQSLHETHAQVFTLLTQATIDRTAVESARVSQMRVAEQVSRRSTQFFLDVSETLTPAQREALAAHMSHHHS